MVTVSKETEKERLMREILYNKARKKFDTNSDIELTTDGIINHQKSPKMADDIMKAADDTLNALKDVLKRQQKDLDNLSKVEQVDLTPNIDDMKALQEEIARDYGISTAEVKIPDMPAAVETPVVIEPTDSGALFESVLRDLEDNIVGQDDQLREVCNAFRRPYVMGQSPGKAKNVILLTGPNGSGKHAIIAQMAKSLYQRKVFASDEVYTIDLSLYQSGSQEQIFLQDLYRDLSGKGSIIVFENFEVGFPSFLRMIDSLVCDGKVVLSRRYVLNKGILVENQTGLVKEAVDSLSAEGKYLVFMTTKGTSAVQDAFGADFLYHVLDTIKLKALTEENIREVIDHKTRDLIERSASNLKLDVRMTQELKDWIVGHYDKTKGADAITQIFDNFYICLSQEVLEKGLGAETVAELVVHDDIASAKIVDEYVSLIRSKTSAEEIKAVNEELDQIVGLEMVKEYIRSLESHIQMQELRRQQGMKVSEISKHMIFTGNPGTGKTTIARLISRYMKAIGALSRGQLVEVTRADLVAQYVGQTAPLTMSVIKSALGGVLFIDEAYSLYRGKDDSFGLECIDTIVKAMEDNRDDLIVILAGYSREMATFLESNSGLKSRFPNTIEFKDYTGDELYQIAKIQAKSKGYVIADEVEERLTDYFNEVQSINAAEAGNGRLARNVVEDAILRQSRRLVRNPDSRMDELKLEDFDFTIKVSPPKAAGLF